MIFGVRSSSEADQLGFQKQRTTFAKTYRKGLAAMTDTPKMAQKGPYPVEVTAGKSYFWCTCGRSDNQPFCDGSHKETSFTPMKLEAEADKTLFFCGCKATGKAPLCDGTHNKL